MATNMFSKFFGGENQGQPLPQQGQPGAQAPQQFTPEAVTQAQSSNVAPPGTTKPEATPIDSFSKIWDTPSAPEGGQPVRDPTKFSYPRFDPNKLTEGVSKMDFTRNLNPDLVTKAMSGDGDAFREALNSAAREAFSNSFQASDRYYSKVFDTYDQSVNARIPKEVGRREIQNLVRTNIKGMDHPAFQPVLNTLQEQLQQHYPDASPQEIASKAQEYFAAMAKSITSQSESDGNNPQGQNTSAPKGSRTITDFSDFG